MFRILLYTVLILCNAAFSLAQVKTEEILIKNNDIELPGTLTYTKENTPLIIWVHGSGNVDRNGNQQPMIKANYIKQFRDSINKNDIAFYSFDKRTANQKNMLNLIKGIEFADFSADVEKVISYFQDKKQFSKIILIGHSQGSLVAMLASKNIDKYISLAGSALSADQVIVKQIHQQAPFLDSITKAHFKELSSTGKVEKVNPMLQSVFAKQNQAFLNSWIKYNPSEEIKKLSLPILIIHGTEDLQITQEDAKALHEANKNSELVLIDKMNHVLKEVNSITENQSSYTSSEFPLSSKLVKTITTFVNN